MAYKIVQCHGCFDLLHWGHLKHLEQAKSMGDKLWVTITADKYIRKGPGRPYYNERQRWEMLKALRCVDLVTIIYDYGPEVAIKTVMPNIYVKGIEYKGRLPEQALVESIGGRVAYTYDKEASRIKTTDLIARTSGEDKNLQGPVYR